MNRINLSEAEPKELTGHTSKGDQPKWQIGEKWYKADHMGGEALSEIVISRLLEHSNLTGFLSYSPVLIEYRDCEYRGCESDNFRKRDEILVPIEKLHRAYKGKGLARKLEEFPEPAEKIRYTVDFIESITGLQRFGAYLTGILEIDTFFLNEDRHTNNIAVIRNETSKQYRLCPIFDNGLGLLSDWNDYPLEGDLYASIKKVKAKPFSSDFEEQMNCAEVLYGSQLKFTFKKADVVQILDNLKEYYDRRILSRTQKVLFEQMRRYPIFF